MYIEVHLRKVIHKYFYEAPKLRVLITRGHMYFYEAQKLRVLSTRGSIAYKGPTISTLEFRINDSVRLLFFFFQPVSVI